MLISDEKVESPDVPGILFGLIMFEEYELVFCLL